MLKNIRLHPLFWLVLGAGVFTGHFKEVLMLFIIVFIHEMGHALTAVYLGWKVNRIELLPFGGVAETEDSGVKPIREEMYIVLAGPLQHIWLCGLSYMFVGQPFWSQYDHQLFLMYNLMIVGFNLLPIYPLDGGRLVQLACLVIWPYKRALIVSLHVSFLLLIVMVVGLLFVPFHLNLYVVVLFLFVIHYLEFKQRHYRFVRFLMAKKQDGKHRNVHWICVNRHVHVREAVALLKRGRTNRFRIVGQHGCSEVDEQMVLAAYFEPGKRSATFGGLFT
ncbi:M50 family metallopeptidase [Bacillus sp. FSL W7-1360]